MATIPIISKSFSTFIATSSSLYCLFTKEFIAFEYFDLNRLNWDKGRCLQQPRTRGLTDWASFFCILYLWVYHLVRLLGCSRPILMWDFVQYLLPNEDSHKQIDSPNTNVDFLHVVLSWQKPCVLVSQNTGIWTLISGLKSFVR